METFSSVGTAIPIQVWAGVTARAVQGDRITFAVLDLASDQDVVEHRHDNEQVGMVLRGLITMRIGGDSRPLSPGDMYVIPSGVPHSALAGPDGASVIDVFTPVRADWEALPRLAPGPGEWPE